MNKQLAKRNKKRLKRAGRVRQRVKAAGHPRLSVLKSNTNIYLQLIDDNKGTVLAATSTASKEFRGTEFGKKSKASARHLGEKMAELIKGMDIPAIAFDRGRFKYHGILAEVANGLRENGVRV
ncbi:MAG: 50S ribosomal protein L18 [Waddliaceae bacterium]|nr:50S ribosomal protein L18 [Waddliaceae bacterium]